MSFADWSDEEFAEVRNGILLLGWRPDSRLTSDDAHMLADIAREALNLHKGNALTPEHIDRLALQAHHILLFEIMNIDERAVMATGPYSDSRFFSPLLNLIDEATVCYYRGLYTGSLAILFIVLESYLRSLAGMPNPSFAQLRASVRNHPDSSARNESEQILSVVYAHYNAASPPQFLFNRHGLFHGLRGADEVDEMNCVRMFLLFDVLCSAERLDRVLALNDEFHFRHRVYSECRKVSSEQALINSINVLKEGRPPDASVMS